MVNLKDNFVGMYIKRFIIPRALIFDKPGFINFKISGKTNVFARQILVPEDFFVNLEKNIVEKYGIKGMFALYSIGKKFGYSFAQLGRFENINDHPGEKIKEWIFIADKFIEGTYASEMNQNTKVNEKIVDVELRNFVICRKLGYDFIFATGGAAGVISWLFQDKNIEGHYYDSKMIDGEHFAKVKCAPFDILKSTINSDQIFSELNVDNLSQNVDLYNTFNLESEIGTTKSFSSYLDAKIFNYENGIITLKSSGERFFLLESSGMYLVELELKKRGIDSELFNIAFLIGKILLGDLSTDIQSAVELFTALGWGEIIVSGSEKIKVIINHFPWTSWYKDIDYLIIRGFLSGVLSKFYDREINLKNFILDVNSNFLILMFTE